MPCPSWAACASSLPCCWPASPAAPGPAAPCWSAPCSPSSWPSPAICGWRPSWPDMPSSSSPLPPPFRPLLRKAPFPPPPKPLLKRPHRKRLLMRQPRKRLRLPRPLPRRKARPLPLLRPLLRQKPPRPRKRRKLPLRLNRLTRPRKLRPPLPRKAPPRLRKTRSLTNPRRKHPPCSPCPPGLNTARPSRRKPFRPASARPQTKKQGESLPGPSPFACPVSWAAGRGRIPLRPLPRMPDTGPLRTGHEKSAPPSRDGRFFPNSRQEACRR